MTVSTEISSNEYTGNGVTTDFDYKFRIFKANQLSVITSDADGDNVVTLRLGTDYTVTGANKSAGGKVILTKPLANGHKISIARDIPITQETSFRNQSKFFAETHEDAFDYLTMILQRIWGSLGSLYLKRPNILANWFDAKGYRIANLGKPKRDSDAADLGTLKDEISGVNSTILKREKRLLRVDDIDIASLPKASVRAGNVLTFDKDGKPIVVAPATGSAVDVLNILNKNSGATLIGTETGKSVQDELDRLDFQSQHPNSDFFGIFNLVAPPLSSRFDYYRKSSPTKRAYVWLNPSKIGGAYAFSLGVNTHGYTACEWEFVYDVDDFCRMNYGYIGKTRSPSFFTDAKNYSVTPSGGGNNRYFRSSDQLNATFDLVFLGTGFIFNHRVDENGGLWAITIDSDEEYIISCNSNNPENEGAISGNIAKTFDGLKDSNHNVTFKFIGNDLDFPPQDGVSRGWFKEFTGSDLHTAWVITGKEMGISPQGNDLVANGIVDFAISATPDLSLFPTDWVPSHGSASGAMNLISRKIYIDGVEINAINIKEIEINNFTMIQKYVAYNSLDAARTLPMWEGTIVTTFSLSDGLSFNHDITMLNDVYISDGYTAMVSGRRSFFNKHESDNGNVLHLTAQPPISNIDHKTGTMTSIALVGEKYKLLMKSNSPAASCFFGSDFNDGVGTLTAERTDGFVKTYFVAFGKNKIIKSGTRLSSSHSIFLTN